MIQPPNKPVGVADTLNCTDELPVFARVMVWVLAAVLAKEAPACSSVASHAAVSRFMQKRHLHAAELCLMQRQHIASLLRIVMPKTYS